MRLEEELLEYIRQGKSCKDIAEIKGYSYGIIRGWINKIDPQKVEEAKNYYLRQEEKEILILIEKGNTEPDIERILGKSYTTIHKIIKRIDEKELKEAKQKGKEYKVHCSIMDKKTSKESTTLVTKAQVKQSLEEELLEYIRQGKTCKDISEIKGYPYSSILKWTNEIDPQKVEEAKKDYLRQQEKEVLILIEKGNTEPDIERILGKSYAYIHKIIKRIDEKELKEAKLKGKEYKVYCRIMDKKNSVIKYGEIKQKLEQKTLEETDIIDYREYIDKRIDVIELKELVLMLNVYIKNRQTNNAIELINLVIDSNKNSKFDMKKLQDIKEQVERIKDTQKQRKIQKARNWLEKDVSVDKVVYYTGLKEQEVMQIKQEVEAKKGIEI